MGKITRIWNFILGIIAVSSGILMFAYPDIGYLIVTLLLGSLLMIRGLQELLYFFTMGIHMVGGKLILYRALIIIDLGAFTLCISGTGQTYVMLYLALASFFSGIVELFRALEAKKLEAGQWKLKLISGLFDMFFAISCIINCNSKEKMLTLLCLCFINSGLRRIWVVFRKTSIVYIQ